MKKLICLTVLLTFVSPGLAQKADESPPLGSLVNTERAFARTSEEKGTRDAFMAFIADDGILFRPTAVKGKQWKLKRLTHYFFETRLCSASLQSLQSARLMIQVL